MIEFILGLIAVVRVFVGSRTVSDPRKVKKLNLLEFTGGCRMSGAVHDSRPEQDVTRRYIAAVNVVLRHSDRSAENPRQVC